MVKKIECSLCASRIREHYPMLSNQEKRVADAVFASSDHARNMTVATLAAEADVSGTTVVRFCRSIGFKGFSDFKMYFVDQLNRADTSWENLNEDDSVEEVAQKVFNYNRGAMNDTMLMLDCDAIEAAVEAILRAKRIFISAGGGAAGSGICLMDAFLQIGIPCYNIQDALFQVMNAHMMGEGDLVIGISHSGKTSIVIDTLARAKKSGAATLAIVGLVGSPVCKHADIILHTGLAEQSCFSKTITARLCELEVISTIYSLIYLKQRDQILQQQAMLDEALAPMFKQK